MEFLGIHYQDPWKDVLEALGSEKERNHIPVCSPWQLKGWQHIAEVGKEEGGKIRAELQSGGSAVALASQRPM